MEEYINYNLMLLLTKYMYIHTSVSLVIMLKYILVSILLLLRYIT